jgi:hypothetical protein
MAVPSVYTVMVTQDEENSWLAVSERILNGKLRIKDMATLEAVVMGLRHLSVEQARPVFDLLRNRHGAAMAMRTRVLLKNTPHDPTPKPVVIHNPFWNRAPAP